MNSTPLVSVVIPVFNRRNMLARSIRSVLAQSWRNLEIIVVDDGSTDDSAHIAERFGSQVRVLREPHRGAYAARNTGIEAARGSFIAFNDSDDQWTPRRLERQMPLFDRPEVGVVYGDAAYVDLRTGAPRMRRRTFFESWAMPFRGNVTNRFVWGNFVGFAGATVRRDCFATCGLFATSPPLSADYLQWFQISKHYEFDYIDAPVYLYAIHENRLTSRIGPSLEARLVHFGRALKIDRTHRETLTQLVYNLSLHFKIWGVRTRQRSHVHQFLEKLRGEGLLPDDLLDRHHFNWSGRFLQHHLHRRPRRLIPWKSRKLSDLDRIFEG